MHGQHSRWWRRWPFQLSFTFAAITALYVFLIGPAYDDYRMGSGQFEKVFRAGTGGQPKDVDFAVRGCLRHTGAPARPDGLMALEWQPDGALLVRYSVSENCAAPFGNGGYSISANVLNLHYQLDYRSPERAACTCAYDLEYRIRDVPRREYTVQVGSLRR